ncbi:hypothetical protein OG618_37825 (plasmid) [Kitasatospora sp. NBC_01246]|uniref:hypothetical protein n=1 Tax=Kitasatospora sp. NBC_01246 TaxID=2903570 RepID=UPI002E2F194F|nr:hypothetical protein [Kitasatospora sp. NBC_01246]
MQKTTAPASTDTGCCQLAPAAATAVQLSELIQARAIARHLPGLGIESNRIAAAWDAEEAAAVVRVDSARGLWALVIPPVGTAFPVRWRGKRVGALDVRRVPALTDSAAAVHLVAYLRDRAAL